MKALKRFFKIEERGSTVSKEVIGGITTFLAMSYILFVNPNTLLEAGMSWGAVFTATGIAAIVGCLIMGLLANYPVAQAPGMGMNAFFTYTIVLGMGATYQEALALVLVSGVIFLLISVTGIRKAVINAIPKDLKFAIGAGIGLFIAFIGLQSSGLIVSNPATLVSLGDFTDPLVLLSVFGLIVTVVLYSMKVKGAILIGIVSTSIVGMIFNLVNTPEAIISLPEAPYFLDFIDGFKTMDFSENLFMYVAAIFSLLFIDFFDTAGTLISVGNSAGLVNSNGELENAEKALVSDATATIVGAVVGTSSTTSYVESLSGVEAGGRTGLTAVIVAGLFFISLFFSPLLIVVSSACTAPALIFVGILMSRQLGEINWNDISVAITSFLVVILMPLTYSIALGMAVAFVFYPLTMLATKRGREINPIMWGLFILFILYFIVGVR